MGGGAIGAPFARLFANLIVMGSGVMGRAFLTAYKEALASACLRPHPWPLAHSTATHWFGLV